MTALLSRVASPAERGVYLGVQQALGGVARVALPVWTGFSIDRFGAGSPFWCGALLGAIGLVLALGIEGAPAATPAVPVVKASDAVLPAPAVSRTESGRIG